MEKHEKALYLVKKYLTQHEYTYEEDSIKLVWFCKTLQNWKALVADINLDGKFFEVTYNGDKKETYIDAYSKLENVRVPD